LVYLYSRICALSLSATKTSTVSKTSKQQCSLFNRSVTKHNVRWGKLRNTRTLALRH